VAPSAADPDGFWGNLNWIRKLDGSDDPAAASLG
jgi:hypothetical protein